ncbi:hypothetical protein [Caballeronia sordidicola]|uniref:hypothetical protein n=1 Tax=Caballeronia sordidicola TaxID=196367 RepID=UPI0004D03165|nr:hypothetical protein [Caballeronia sordidicola]
MKHCITLACTFFYLIFGAQPTLAQKLTSGDLPVGSGKGQVGLVMALNEECHGPATISATSDARLAILDRVNDKLVIVGGPAAQDVALPANFIEPTDFIATERGYLVVGALGEVILVDPAGAVLARSNTDYDPTLGSPRLVSLSTGKFVLENLSGKRFPIKLDQSTTGPLVSPGLALASDYTKTLISPGKIVLQSKTVDGDLSSITVTSKIRISNARPIWVKAGDGALIALQESQKYPQENAFVRLINIDARGHSTTEAYLSLETFACDTVRPYTRLTDGTVVVLKFKNNNSLGLEVLKFMPVGTATPIIASQGSEVALIASELSASHELEVENGTSDASNISVSSISVASILQRARRALNLQWLLTPSAYSQSDIENRCDPPTHIWTRPRQLEGKLSTTMTGVPYDWGGYVPDLNVFTMRLNSNYLAGNVCTCRSGNCVQKRATGMDCSGFVSYAWHIGSYFTTSSLPNPDISNPISWSDLSPGDIINKRANHVRLVEGVAHSTNGDIVTVIESTTAPSCGGVCRRSYSALQLEAQGYRPYRRVALVSDKDEK